MVYKTKLESITISNHEKYGYGITTFFPGMKAFAAFSNDFVKKQDIMECIKKMSFGDSKKFFADTVKGYDGTSVLVLSDDSGDDQLTLDMITPSVVEADNSKLYVSTGIRPLKTKITYDDGGFDYAFYKTDVVLKKFATALGLGKPSSYIYEERTKRSGGTYLVITGVEG